MLFGLTVFFALHVFHCTYNTESIDERRGFGMAKRVYCRRCHRREKWRYYGMCVCAKFSVEVKVSGSFVRDDVKPLDVREGYSGKFCFGEELDDLRIYVSDSVRDGDRGWFDAVNLCDGGSRGWF